VIDKPEYVATPATAVMEAVPDNVPEFPVRATLIDPANPTDVP
jgi:hypothetical protein